MEFNINEQNVPDREKVSKVIAKSRFYRQQLELAALELEELILQIEAQNCQKRTQQLKLSQKSLN